MTLVLIACIVSGLALAIPVIRTMRACLCYMSEDDVRDMAHANELDWPGNDNYSDEEGDEE